MSNQFYEDRLYPFQNKILEVIGSVENDFYLTGGTALSRFYLNHRFSDDLDLFVNRAEDFKDQVDRILSELKRNSLPFRTGARSDDFLRIIIQGDEIRLKMDFVNDIEPHFGLIQKTAWFPRVDSWRNILSNKICTLSRREPKDYVDIIFLSIKYDFEWEEIIREAHEKDLWVEPIEISRLFKKFPLDSLTVIRWAQPVNFNEIRTCIGEISRDILLGKRNSLSGDKGLGKN